MDVSREPGFWCGYFTGAFFLRSDDFEPERVARCFGMTAEAGDGWWRDFTGWYEGVIQEADGQVDQPGRLEVALEGGNVLQVEAHPGDVYVHRVRAPDGLPPDLLANFGPHWWLPAWTLAAARREAGSSAIAFLLLAPLVRLRTDDERAEGARLFLQSWAALGVVDARSAELLCQAWLACRVDEQT